MNKQEYIKKQRKILLKLAEGITWQPYTELNENKEYFTLEEAQEALYQLHIEGVWEEERLLFIAINKLIKVFGVKLSRNGEMIGLMGLEAEQREKLKK